VLAWLQQLWSPFVFLGSLKSSSERKQEDNKCSGMKRNETKRKKKHIDISTLLFLL